MSHPVARRINPLAVVPLTVALMFTLAGSALPAAQATSSGDRSVFVPIRPCRLFDTRPGTDNVGGRSSPLGAGETFTLTVRGAQGACNLPADAVAVAMNVAIIAPTQPSFLTVFPAGTDLPLASNLNWVAGQPPTPNKVDVGLSADGRLSFYNLAGSVHVAADVSGYYVAHDHDDRYYRKDETYTKAEVDAAVAAAVASVRLPKNDRVVVGAASFVLATGWSYFDLNSISGANTSQTVNCAHTEVGLPDGATVTRFSAFVSTNAVPAQPLTVRLSRKPIDTFSASTMATLPSASGNGPGVIRSTTTITTPVVSTAQATYVVEACGTGAVVSATVEFTRG